MNDLEKLLEVFDAIGVEYEQRETSSSHVEIIIRGDGAYLGHYHSFEFDEDGNLFLHGSYDD